VTVRNRHDFRDLSGFAFEWALQENGVTIAGGQLPALATKARATQSVVLPLPKVEPKAGAEYFVTVRAKARAGSVALTPEGYVVGWEQFALGQPTAPAATTIAGAVDLKETAESVALSAGGVSLTVDRKTGLVTGYGKVGVVAADGRRAQLLPGRDRQRHPDRHGVAADAVEGHDPGASGAVDHRPPPAGRRGRGRRRSRTGGRRGPLRHHLHHERRRDRRRVRPADAAEERPAAAGPRGPGLLDARRRQDGRMVRPGPHETYVDRRTSAPIGLWRGPIAEQNHDYMRPQDTGNKVDVRWMEVSGAARACGCEAGRR
jgi:beta-galactosidase